MGPRIVVYESSDPLLVLRLKKKVPGGGTLPYSLDGAQDVALVVKEDPDEVTIKFDYKLTEGNVAVIDDGSGVSDEYAEITVQCAAADLTPPGVYYYHVYATKAGKKDPINDGFFQIVNI